MGRYVRGSFGTCNMAPAEIPDRNFSSNLAPETIFRKVRRLSPGTMLIVADGQVRTRKFWDMQYGTGRDSRSEFFIQPGAGDNLQEGPTPFPGNYVDRSRWAGTYAEVLGHAIWHRPRFPIGIFHPTWRRRQSSGRSDAFPRELC